MSSSIDLKPNEYVVMKSQGIRHGGAMASYTKELVLTNLSIIVVSPGMLGMGKKTQYFPLSDVKVIDDRPQAIPSGNELEVYFVDRLEKFGFSRKKEVTVWAENLCSLLLGESHSIRTGEDKAVPGAVFVAETLRDTVDTFKRSFGKARNAAPERVARVCTSCGASNSGFAGRVVQCQHCGSYQQL